MLVVVVALAACSGDKQPADKRPTKAAAPIDARLQLDGVDVPVVAAHGLVPLHDAPAMIVVATPKGIMLEGKLVASLRDAAVDPADLEGGALGMKIAGLTSLAASIPLRDQDPFVLLLLDKQLPALLLHQIVFSVNSAGAFRRFGIAALGDGAPMMVPFALPEARSSSSVEDALSAMKRGGPDANVGPPTPVQPVVTITRDRVILWSKSRILGTLQSPRLTVTDLSAAGPALTEELAAFAASRWSGAQRTDRERELIIMPFSDQRLQTVVEVMGAVRADATGAELFPTLLLSAGIE
jgi:hypothetical protein